MTVCIAAHSEDGMIWCAADRMVTGQDVEFEPQMPKINPITNSIIIMTAGDSSLHSEIYQGVFGIVTNRIEKEPDNWWKVKDVVDLYVNYYNYIKLSRAEATILAPLGLNNDTFITRQQQMNDVFITNISKELLNFNVPYVSAIVAGVDNSGAHIFTVRREIVDCMDGIGFASIGIGSRHAESQFMFGRHSRRSPSVETLLLTFFAKKRAEVAPGVGTDTDMYMIGPQLGYAVPIIREALKSLEKIYAKNVEKEKNIQNEAQDEMRKYVEKASKAEGEQQKQKPDDPTEPTGEKTPLN